MKKILILIIAVFVVLVFLVPTIYVPMNFSSDKEMLNIVPKAHDLSPARDFVVITDEIPLFKKYLVETPIDLNLKENSPTTVMLVSEDDEERSVTFNLKSVADSNTKDSFFNFDYLSSILNTTYKEVSLEESQAEKKSTFNFLTHSKLLSQKKQMSVGEEILLINAKDKRGYVLVSGDSSVCTSAFIYISQDLVDISLCKISEGERDYILNSLKTDY